MNLTIQLPKEFLKHTVSSGSLFTNTISRENISNNISTSCSGLIIEIPQVTSKSVEPKDIDSFINELLAQDKINDNNLSDARKVVADVLYEEQDSLKTLRLRAGLSQAQLAEKIGMKQPNICELEAGKRKPNVDTLKKLADALGTTADIVLRTLNQSE